MLLLIEAPVEFVKPLQKIIVLESQPAIFTCEVANVGSDMPVTWYKDGKVLPADNKNIVMEATGNVLSLHILSTTLDDEAEYSVVVGKTKSKAELLVDGEINLLSPIAFKTDGSISIFLPFEFSTCLNL